MAKSGKAFDFKLFKRLLQYTNNYRLTFYFVAFAAIAMSGLSILRPYLLQEAIDVSIIPQDGDGFLYYVMAMLVVLFLEVIFQRQGKHHFAPFRIISIEVIVHFVLK